MAKLKNKKGCLKYGILFLVAFVIVAVVAVILILNSLNNQETFNTRLTELLCREYTPPTNMVDEYAVTSFNNKISTTVSALDGEPLVVNNVLDVARFVSNNIVFRSQLVLNRYDIAVFVNDFFANQNVGDSEINSAFSLVNLDIDYQVESMRRIVYRATFQVELDKMLTLPVNKSQAPEYMYLTLSATYNLDAQTQNAIESASLSVNGLWGDDNTYAVEQILAVFDKTTNDIAGFARAPFEYITRQCQVWGVIFGVEKDSLDNTLFTFGYRTGD